MGTINRSCAKSDLMIVVRSSGPAGCAILRDLPPVWPLLAGSRARRSEQMGWQRTHTHRLGGRAVNIYFVHHAEVIRCEHKMVYYFHVRRIQNLLQMIMAQGFPAWAEEGMLSRATGVVWLISTLVQSDRERKKTKKKKTSVSSRRPGCVEDCRSVTQKRPQI